MADIEIFSASRTEVLQCANESRAFVREIVGVLFRYGLSEEDMNALFPLGPFEPPAWESATGFTAPVPDLLDAIARRAEMMRQADDELLFRSRPN